MGVGSNVAMAITTRFYQCGGRKGEKYVAPELTPEQVASITARGTLGDMCGALHGILGKGSDIDKRNARLLYNLAEAIGMSNTAHEASPYEDIRKCVVDTDTINEACRLLNDFGVVSNKDASLLNPSSKQLVEACDEIYINLLPAFVETYAYKIGKVQLGEASRLGYDEYANSILY